MAGLVEGHFVHVGSPDALLTDADPLDTAAARAITPGLEQHGYTPVLVCCEHRPVGVLALRDQLRHEAASTVSAVGRLTGSAPVLLTGDHAAPARQLAATVGISEVRAGLLPDDKVAALHQLQSAGHRVTVLGDGLNDAPAFAAAHTGIAMGRAGSDLALQTADAVSVRDDLTTLPAVLTLARQARRLVTANLILAAGCITGLVACDLLGTLPLPLGVAGHEGSTILVALNGLRLLRPAA